MDHTGCSDLDSICSEFSSTPNTSVHSTPTISPEREPSGGPLPSTSGASSKPKGKDLSLLLATKPKGAMLPKDSLYFREMARTKKTARKKTGKTPRKNLQTKNPMKKLTAAQA